MKRTAQAVWHGSGMEGEGVLNTPSQVFSEQPYSFKKRFENEDGTLGTNPEELIAAAHAGCFNMALSFQLGFEDFTPEELATHCTVTMENIDGGFKIVNIHLSLVATVPGISKEKFLEIAESAKASCPISQALSATDITMDAKLA